MEFIKFIRETLIYIIENANKYTTLTIRVSSYAVNLNRLTREEQLEVISRRFNESI